MIKKILILILILLAAAAAVGYVLYGKFFEAATAFSGREKVVFVRTGSDFSDLKETLKADSVLQDFTLFDILAERKKFSSPKPGRYAVKAGASINDIINLLRSGNQTPVRVTFNQSRKVENVAGKVSTYLEQDSTAFAQYLTDPARPEEFGFSPQAYPSMFIPDTYEFYWNTTPEAFAKRMKKEYDLFWTGERKAKADALKMTPLEVVTLASIVKEETAKRDEAPKIAGVYLNRLRIGMALQADPTLKFALNDFTIKRLLHEDKEVESPYNTYKYTGLPPGPINLPERTYIDAVLNAESHNYIYFCAKADFSGYSNFSTSLEQHKVYAREYHRALNKNRIFR